MRSDKYVSRNRYEPEVGEQEYMDRLELDSAILSRPANSQLMSTQGVISHRRNKSMGSGHMLSIYTSQIVRYNGPDALDITVKSGSPFGPTWYMVYGIKYGKITEDEYASMYHEILQTRYERNPEVFEELLSRKQVTLLCYCPPGRFCHRVLLAEWLRDNMEGHIVYEGERT